MQRGEKPHRRALIQIPTPRYIVFYNGLDERPEREILYLSDVFVNKRGEARVRDEIKAKDDELHARDDKISELKQTMKGLTREIKELKSRRME